MRRISQAINTSSLAAQSLEPILKLAQQNVAPDVVTKTCLCDSITFCKSSGVIMTVDRTSEHIDIAAEERELVVVSVSSVSKKNIKIFYQNIEKHLIALHCPLSALRFDEQPALTCTALTSL